MSEESNFLSRVLLVDYPASSEYTRSAIKRAAAKVLPDWRVVTCLPDEQICALQFSDYDSLRFEWAMQEPTRCMLNAYVIRKALIRKHHMPTTVNQYLAKHPDSVLRQGIPETYTFHISFADELDDLLLDDLYELKEAFDADSDKWWILKPAMADRGQGIQLFRTEEDLTRILEGHEDDSEEESDTEEGQEMTLGQMRYWVIQAYITNPLLVMPKDSTSLRKFHLRVYVLAVGALKLYVSKDILALFANAPYEFPPRESESEDAIYDLTSHLTNTCLQDLPKEANPNVHLFNDLIGSTARFASGERSITQEDVDQAFDRLSALLAETWKAALGSGSQFQPLPNAFELYGVDILLDDTNQPYLLEINACPDFAQTGTELAAIIDRLFENTLKIVVLPFFDKEDLAKTEAETPELHKCLEVEVRSW